MKGLKKEIKDIAFENGLTPHDTEMIIRSQFKMLLNEMQSPEMEPVRLIYLGVFGVKPYRKLKMEEKFNKKKDE